MCSELPLSVRVPIVYIPKVCLATNNCEHEYILCMYEYMYKDVMRMSIVATLLKQFFLWPLLASSYLDHFPNSKTTPICTNPVQIDKTDHLSVVGK